MPATATATSAWKQVVAALVLVPALGVGLWKLQASSSDASNTSGASARPAKCREWDEKEKIAPGHASGGQLCAALNRADLPELLGTPAETAKSASSSGGSFTFASGSKIATPSARVELDTYTVTLQASYDRLPVAEAATLLGQSARRHTLLGRPAVVYADRTISMRISLGGGDSESSPGVPEHSLVVARDTKDSGGSFEVTLWRADGAVPDDDVLFRVAEAVLP
ncbi:DUF6215 domain-containing protein, partial [Actinacidiphila rubida]|uniref:DUF6215 domain-containing protein n=1 Tax=Actinacidiphila rubida TaxID=310780 RepID=UPI00099FBBAF